MSEREAISLSANGYQLSAKGLWPRVRVQRLAKGLWPRVRVQLSALSYQLSAAISATRTRARSAIG